MCPVCIHQSEMIPGFGHGRHPRTLVIWLLLSRDLVAYTAQQAISCPAITVVSKFWQFKSCGWSGSRSRPATDTPVWIDKRCVGALARVGPTLTSRAVGDCVPFAPTAGAQSAVPHRENFPMCGFESWFRRAARGYVERGPGACVSAETTTRRDFPRKPVKKSRVVQPLVDASDRASIIAAYEEGSRAHSSFGPRESRFRKWRRLHFCGLTTPSMSCPSHLERSVPSLWPTFQR